MLVWAVLTSLGINCTAPDTLCLVVETPTRIVAQWCTGNQELYDKMYNKSYRFHLAGKDWFIEMPVNCTET